MQLQVSGSLLKLIAKQKQCVCMPPKPLVHPCLNTVGMLDIHASFGGYLVQHPMWQQQRLVNFHWWVSSTLSQWNLGNVVLLEMNIVCAYPF